MAGLGAASILFSQVPAPAAADEPVAITQPAPTTDPVAVADPVATADPVVTIDPIVAAAPVIGDVPVVPVSAVPIKRPAPTTRSAASAVVKAAESHLGARYRAGSIGPRAFDCSGLVYSAFTQVGLKSRIGGLRSARGLYAYFARHHLASRSAPKVGDLVIWGGGVHVGIYIGSGRAISALVSGVRITRVSAVLSGFTTYLHTRLANVKVALPKATKPHTASSVTKGVRHVTSVAALRGAAGTTHKKTATLHRGARLTVLGSHRLTNHQLWLHVRTAGGKIGWVAEWLTRA